MSNPSEEHPDIQRRDDAHVQADCQKLIEKAEDIRLKFMHRYRNRTFASTTISIISILIGAGAFGWFFLMNGALSKALLSMAISVVLTIIVYKWSKQPLGAYKRYHKSTFMPQMAKVLGGMKFHPARGISGKIIARTGVVPPHERYDAEDCFMGMYKGVKVILSEARLYKRQSKDAVFDGVFALIETPEDTFTGHTIITSDVEMISTNKETRWKELKSFELGEQDPKNLEFHAFSNKPDKAREIVTDKLLKELSEAADIFGKVALTAVLFRRRYIFLMIPCEDDLFEASNVYVPVTTKALALSCKKEIDRILEIIDIFEIYKKSKT